MKRFRKTAALILVLLMLCSSCFSAGAAELKSAALLPEASAELKNDAPLPETAAELKSAAPLPKAAKKLEYDAPQSETSAKLDSTIAALSSMEPGVDYIDGRGFFLADTREEALETAAAYGALLKSYSHRIAVIEFPGSTIDALTYAASLDSVEKAVDPDYTARLFSEVYDESLSGAELSSSVSPNDYYANTTEMRELKLQSSKYTVPVRQYFHDKIHTLTAQQTSTGAGVKIAVIDTGCIPDHEDSSFDSEHALKIDTMDSPVDNRVGHGVHTTGVIHEKKDNLLGGYGIAPDAEIYSIKITDTREFSTSVIAEGVAVALEKNVNVISLSLGGPWTETMEQLFNEAYERGITAIAAAGNEGISDYTRSYPAALDTVIAVAATDMNDALASYSDYGSWVDIAAPGSFITSSYITGAINELTDTGDNRTTYGCISGTSMACPVVAGVAALCYGANPELIQAGNRDAADAVRAALLNTTDNKEYVYGNRSITGLVQADKALEEAKKFKEITNKYYSLVDMAGNSGACLSGKISKGKSIKLNIGDLSGNIKDKRIKSEAKNALWVSSNPSVITVKKGKIKCNKKAAAGSKATITVTLRGDTMTCDLTVIKPVISAGYTYTVHSGKKTKLVIKKSNDTKMDRLVNGNGGILKKGATISLTDPSKNRINTTLVYSKKALDVDNDRFGYIADDSFNYAVTVKNRDIEKGNISIEKDSRGRAVKAVFNKAGKYTVKFKTTDGSGCSFRYVVKIV